MKAISINILSRIKMFITLNGLTDKRSTISNKKQKSNTGKAKVDTETADNSDFPTFQRKAYMGNFMAGPMALFHPDLFK